MQKKINKKILLTIIIITLLVIWIHSFMPPDMSENESGFVVRILEVVFGRGNVNHLLVRKLAHFTEYLILGCEFILYFEEVHIAAFHGLFVAVVDESIQIFSGRGSSLLDVWLDFAGCITGILILYFINKKASSLEQGKK